MKRFSVFVIVSLVSIFANADQLKKISVVETNNAPFFLNSGIGVFSANFDLSYLKELREYTHNHGFNPEGESEVKFVSSTLAWVNRQWAHDGLNQPPPNSRALEILKSVYENQQKYRCVEFGIVLSEVLQSEGFVTRTLALRSQDVAYGGMGQGHVAMEVWMNSLNKWVFLDGQFGAYVTRPGENIPLNYYEVFQERISKNWDKLNFHFVQAGVRSEEESQKYKSFLTNYFGYISVSCNATMPKIALLLELKENILTFQGFGQSEEIFTDDPKLFYPEMNRVAVSFRYRAEQPNFPELAKKLHIQTNEDYLSQMAKFAAKPEFTVMLRTTQPLFEKFEYRESMGLEWKTIEGATFDWDAFKPLNKLEVRAINKLGRPGPITSFKIYYE